MTIVMHLMTNAVKITTAPAKNNGHGFLLGTGSLFVHASKNLDKYYTNGARAKGV